MSGPEGGSSTVAGPPGGGRAAAAGAQGLYAALAGLRAHWGHDDRFTAS